MLVSVRRRRSRADGHGAPSRRPVDAFWLQLEGRRTVTLGAPVARGTPADLPAGAAGRGTWRTLDAESGDALAPAPVDTARRRLPRPLAGAVAHLDDGAGPRGPRARAALAAWDIASGSVDRIPSVSRRRLWTQIPAIAGPRRRGTFRLTTPDGVVDLPIAARPLANAWPRCRGSPRRPRAVRRRRYRRSRARPRRPSGSPARIIPENRARSTAGVSLTGDAAGAETSRGLVRVSRRRGRRGGDAGGRHDVNGGGGAHRPRRRGSEAPRPRKARRTAAHHRPAMLEAMRTGSRGPARSRPAALPRHPPGVPRTSVRVRGPGAGRRAGGRARRDDGHGIGRERRRQVASRAAPIRLKSVIWPARLICSSRIRRSRVIRRGEPGVRLKPRPFNAFASESSVTVRPGAW